MKFTYFAAHSKHARGLEARYVGYAPALRRHHENGDNVALGLL